jgi:hypothetical protein
MPATTDAHASGALSPDHVDLLAHAASHERGVVFARDEEVLVESCQALRYPEAVKAVSYWRRHADALVDAPEPLVEPVLHIGAGASGEVRLTGHLDPLGGAIVTAALERIAGELTSDGAPRPKGRLQHDALVEMAQRAMAAPPGARRPAPLVTVLVGDESLRHVCELDTGTVVHPRHVAPYVADAIVQTFIFDGPRSPLAATPQRTFTGALRRAIQARDRHCQHPSGCDEPIRRCDVDHIVPHSRGGPTAPANGRLLCTFHNRILPAHTSPQVTGPRPDD